MIHGLTDRVAKSAIQSIAEADDIFDRETDHRLVFNERMLDSRDSQYCDFRETVRSAVR
jgi:hypothetical protein